MEIKTLARHVFHPLLAAAILLTAGSVFAQAEKKGGVESAEARKGVVVDIPAITGGKQQIIGTVTKVNPKTNTVTVKGEGFDVTLPAGNVGLPSVGQRVRITLECSAPPLRCTLTIEL